MKQLKKEDVHAIWIKMNENCWYHHLHHNDDDDDDDVETTSSL